MPVSRRHFLVQLAASSGYAAAAAAMTTLGLGTASAASVSSSASSSSGRSVLPALAPGSGKGKRVLVLGAGIAGLVSAYELRRAGYDVQLIEARDRVGGRNWTIRDGTTIDYIDGTQQVAQFEPGHYFNAGPARLPSHHQAILGYCREFGVQLEAEVNTSRSAYFLPDPARSDKPIQLRRAINDARGHIAELLARAVGKGALDQELTADDRAKLVDFLKVYGDLTPQGAFQGTERSGYKVFPGTADQVGQRQEPLSLDALLDPDLWTSLIFDELLIFQPTMLQPVGGMDRIPAAFYERLQDVARLSTEVKSIRNADNTVEVVVRDRRSGQQEKLSADFAVVTFPLPVLAQVANNFAPAVQAAIAGVRYDTASKIAWQSRRFWETDTQIYGGISIVKHETALIWYPSGGYHNATGVLVGCYNISQAARDFTAKPLAAQFASSRGAIDRVHPGRGAELHHPVSVAWHKVPYSLGSWVHWATPAEKEYTLLNQPDGRVHFAGEYLSQIGAWQEGAVLSAHHAVAAIASRI